MQVDSSVELGRDDPALEFPWASDDVSIHYKDLKNNPVLIDDISEAQSYCELREFLLRVNAPQFPLQTAKSDIWATDEILPEEEIFAAPQKLISYVDLVFSTPERRLSLDSHLELVNKLCTLLQHAPDMPASIEFIIRHCYYHEAVRAAPDKHDHSAESCDLRTRRLSDLNNGPEAANASGSAAHDPAEPPEQDSLTHATAAESPMSIGADPDLRCGFSITVYVSGFGDDEQQTRQRWSIALKLLQHALLQVARV